jgi:glutathione S-transferase
MSDKPKLTYFDAPVSRGEECRLALSVAGVDFEDNRLSREAWQALKPKTPFGSLPTLEWPGHPILAQSNAMLLLIGRLKGLHPTDPWEAARHEEILAACEDLRHNVAPTIRISDEAEKKKAREALATGYLPAWGANVEKHITGDGPFFGGNKVQVVDIKLHIIVRWFNGGKVDYIPATIFDAYPKLVRVHDAVKNHDAVRAWYAKTA